MTQLLASVATSSVRTSLIARSSSFAPDEITVRLGLEPTRVRRRTEESVQPRERPGRDHWEWTLGTSEGDRLTSHLSAIAASLPHKVPSEIQLFVFTTLASQGDAARFTATAATLERLAQLPAHLVLDLQPPSDPDTHDDEQQLLDVGLMLDVPGTSFDTSPETTHRSMNLVLDAWLLRDSTVRVRFPSRAPAEVPLAEHIAGLSDAPPDGLAGLGAELDVQYAATSGQGSLELAPGSLHELARHQVDLSIGLHRSSSLRPI